jgi:hypothetical protein
MSDEKEWREELKQGDAVIVAGWRSKPGEATVDRATPARVKVAGRTFTRAHGEEYGARESWARRRILKPGGHEHHAELESLKKREQQAAERTAVVEANRRINKALRDLSSEKLLEIVAWISERFPREVES